MVPLTVAFLFFRKRWLVASIWLLAGWLVDVDHLLADPIYDPTRCSIGFHPLHTWFPIAVYGVMCWIKPVRLLGLGLVIHMLLDSIDCRINTGVWFV